jgi:dephospho-CoA kinase
MKKIGITGGIGSGKSMACRLFSLLGIPVYDADAAAKRLMETSSELTAAIKSLLGEDAYLSDGRLNRPFIAEAVFGNPALLSQVNGLVHPAVAADFNTWMNSQATNTPYVIREAAIMLESGTNKDLDALVLVDAPETLRLERVLKRDGRSEEEVKSIMQRQWSTEEKKKYCQYILVNDDKHLLIPQVIALDRIFRQPS